MSIKEKGYSHWDGMFETKRFPWWPITRSGIRLGFQKKFFKFLFVLALLPAFAFLVGIYISERLEDFKFLVQGEVPDFLTVNPAFFRTYFTNDFLLFMIIGMMVFAGAGLISDDLKYNSLQLYFSRPLKKYDYFLGKSGVIAFFLFILTLVPGLIFILMKLLFSGSLKFLGEYPWLPISVIVYSIFLTGFFAFYTLLISSLNKNRRYVSILIFGIYIFSDIIYGIFYGIFGSAYFSLLSIKANLKQVGAVIFGQPTPNDVPWVFSLLIVLGICAVSALVLSKKVRGVEVIK